MYNFISIPQLDFTPSLVLLSGSLRGHERRFLMRIFEKRLEEKLRTIKEEILMDYAEIFDEKQAQPAAFDRQSSGQATERSDLFMLN